MKYITILLFVLGLAGCASFGGQNIKKEEMGNYALIVSGDGFEMTHVDGDLSGLMGSNSWFVKPGHHIVTVGKFNLSTGTSMTRSVDCDVIAGNQYLIAFTQVGSGSGSVACSIMSDEQLRAMMK